MKLPDIKKLLSSHTGFAASKEWLQEIADSHEVLINYFPKFHCELNFIEMVWCFTKCHIRRDCTFSFHDLKVKLPMLQTRIHVYFSPNKVYQHCIRRVSYYRIGLTGSVQDFEVKRFSRHRSISPDDLANIRMEYEESFQKLNKKIILLKQIIVLMQTR